MIEPSSSRAVDPSVLVSPVRRSRNVALGVLLSALALMFYALAFVKLGHH